MESLGLILLMATLIFSVVLLGAPILIFEGLKEKMPTFLNVAICAVFYATVVVLSFQVAMKFSTLSVL